MARILVIDDERNIRNMIRLTLEHVGHTITEAANGSDGLAKFGSGTGSDMVLLDHRMTGMSGSEVLTEVRRRDPLARVILITAFGTVDLAVEAMKAGAADVLCKPFTAVMLREAVNAAMAETKELPNTIDCDAITTFGYCMPNGFRIERCRDNVTVTARSRQYHFVVCEPSGERHGCYVVLPAYVVELAKARSGQERMPGGDRFWEAFCEEALASYLLKHSAIPPESVLEIDDLTAADMRWMESVISTLR